MRAFTDRESSEPFEVISPELEADLQAVEAKQHSRASAASNKESAPPFDALQLTSAETAVNEAEVREEMKAIATKESSVGEAEAWEKVKDILLLTQKASWN